MGSLRVLILVIHTTIRGAHFFTYLKITKFFFKITKLICGTFAVCYDCVFIL